MSLTPESRALLRGNLVAQLCAARPVAVAVPTLLQGARLAGWPSLTTEQLEAELEYLRGRGLVEATRHALSAALVRWQITSVGIDHAEMEGLA